MLYYAPPAPPEEEEEFADNISIPSKDKIEEIINTDLPNTENKGKGKDNPDIITSDDNSKNESIFHNAWENVKSFVTPNLTPKASFSDLNPTLTPKARDKDLTPLNELIDKGSKLQTFEDLKDTDKLLLEHELLKLTPDEIIDKFKHSPDFVEDSYIDRVIVDSIDKKKN